MRGQRADWLRWALVLALLPACALAIENYYWTWCAELLSFVLLTVLRPGCPGRRPEQARSTLAPSVEGELLFLS